jgi:hypothetical protein
MPEGLRALPADGAALLVETRAATAAALAVKIDAIVSRARPLRSRRAAALRDRPGRGGGALERAQGHVPGGRRDATTGRP